MKSIIKKSWPFSLLILILIFEFLIIKNIINIPTEYNLFGINFRFYGLTMTLAIAFVAFMFERQKKNLKTLKEVKVEDLLLAAVIPGFIGARIYHVITDWHLYSNNPMNAFNIFAGGLGIIGALIGGAIGVWLYAQKNRIDFFELSNLIILYLPIAQFIGRIGNLLNVEIIGKSTDLPWGWIIDNRPGMYHPLFMYEQIMLILIFIILKINFDRNTKVNVEHMEGKGGQGTKGNKKINLIYIYLPLYLLVWGVNYLMRF